MPYMSKCLTGVQTVSIHPIDFQRQTFAEKNKVAIRLEIMSFSMYIETTSFGGILYVEIISNFAISIRTLTFDIIFGFFVNFTFEYKFGCHSEKKFGN